MTNLEPVIKELLMHFLEYDEGRIKQRLINLKKKFSCKLRKASRMKAAWKLKP